MAEVERVSAEATPAVVGWDAEPSGAPPWATEPEPPELARYLPIEVFVAGALSTLPPFDRFHPAWALSHARQALDATMEWEPTDG